MIVWNGLGFLVAVIVFGCSLAFNFAFNVWLGEGYYDTHKWPFAISLLLSAIICWFLGSALRKRNSQTVIDKATGEEMVLDRSNHSLFFIPIHLWGPILAVAGCIVLVMDLLQ
ncbi:MAG: hypothetical protein ACYC6Y_14465 [Thermoguttaceae bacterium]